jgi:hemoglobin/transferrin/lactoferrin receptor protein
MPKLYLVAVFLAAVIFPAFPLTAQIEPQGPSLSPETISLDVISVTSTRVERELAEIPLSVSVVGAEKIDDDPRPDVVDYLRDVPGVQVTQSFYSQKQYSLRGHGSDRTMILVDGVKQRYPSTLLTEEAGGINIDPSEIERIEVIKGPASALYGSDAIGGVINVVTKKGGGRPIGVNAGLLYDGSVNGWKPRVALFGEKGGFYFRVSGSTFHGEDMKLPDSKTFYHTARKSDYYSARFGYEFDRGEIDLAFSGFQGWRNSPALHTNYYKQFPPSSVLLPTGSRYSKIPKEKRYSARGTLTLNDLTPVVKKVLLKAYVIDESTYSDFKMNMPDPTDPYKIVVARSSVVKGEDSANSFGLSLQTDLALSPTNFLILGVDFESGESQSTGRYGGYYQNFVVSEDRKGETRSVALFAQDEWEIVKDLTLTLGLRYTETMNAIRHDSALPERIRTSHDDIVVGSLGVVYQGINNLSLRALYSQGFRAPTLSATMGKTQRDQPNSDLEPETSDNFELGARYVGYGLNVDLALFYSILDKPFYYHTTSIPHPSQVGFYYQYSNAKRVVSYGAELFVSYDIENLGLTPYLSLTALSYERETNDGLKSKDTGVPRSFGVGGIRFNRDFGEEWRFFADGSLTWSAGHFDVAFASIGARINPPIYLYYEIYFFRLFAFTVDASR